MRKWLRRTWFWDSSLDMLSCPGILAVLAGAIVLLFALVFVGVTYGGRAYGKPTCRHWGEQVGVQTKFVILNWADSGTCLARTPAGLWVPSSRWQAFVGGSK